MDFNWTAKQWNQWFDSAEFDIEYEYHGHDLGASYAKERTTWRLWAPTAQNVCLQLYKTGSDDEQGAEKFNTVPMEKKERGVWSLTLEGNWAGIYYTYLVTNIDKTVETADPYAQAAGVNGRRSMVVDLVSTDPEGWEQDVNLPMDKSTDAVIWEIHVKDFSWDPASGMKYRGKYLAFTEEDTHVKDHPELPTGIAYLKKLGITHVHLMPCYDYLTVDESDDKKEQYNWGYDPQNFNVPEGSYSTDPYHGEVRIREFKQMVQALHQAGIGVILDVVYNHTFQYEDSAFQRTVPYYYYRTWPDGTKANGSGCGNEVATERPMVRKYIIDSILYWAKEYHLDGFRFDLMGLYDVETMNMIRAELDKLPGGTGILMYGEPWGAEPPQLRKGCMAANKNNIRLLDNRIAVFNDETRDSIKGSVFDVKTPGFINGAWYQEGAIRNSLQGWAGPFSTVKMPTQTVSYVSAHDNFTLWDKLVNVENLAPAGYDVPNPSCMAANKMAAALVLLAQGIPFMQAGEEFGRTKKGDGNSYHSLSSINQLDWARTGLFGELLEYYKGLIQIRKSFSALRCTGGKSIRKMVFSKTEPMVVALTLPGRRKDPWRLMGMIFNASAETKKVKLLSWEDNPLPKEWLVLANESKAGVIPLGTVSGDTIEVKPHSVLVLVNGGI